MRSTTFAVLALLTLFVACRSESTDVSKQPANSETQKNRLNAETVESGSLGTAATTSADGRWACELPFYRKGKQQIILGLIATPANPWRPAFVLLFRLHDSQKISTTVSQRTVGDMKMMRCGFESAAGDRFQFEYGYAILKTPISESLSLGGVDYSFESGRVFLVDLSSSKSTVTQLDVDIPVLFPPDADDAYVENNTKPEHLETLRDDLAKANQRVREFIVFP